MKYLITALLAIAPTTAWAQDCPPQGWDRARLDALRASGFEIAEQGRREAFARAVVACVASPDPGLRDGMAYEGLTRLLRGDRLGAAVKTEIARDLLRRLASRDPGGFEAPFAALILAEIVRADGVAPYLPDDLRSAIVDGAVHYVTSLRDYRGFDEREGWRHGVAHGADLLMQIARSPRVPDRATLERVRAAIAAQVAPAGHFYIYGEPERLMLPVIMLARRGVFTEAEWTSWFAALAQPAPSASWEEAMRGQSGLAKRHNVRAFLYAVWLNARIGSNAEDDVLLAGAEAALRAMS